MKIQLGKNWRKPVNGEGGFEDVMRELVTLADDTGLVVIDSASPLADRVRRYVKKYGRKGGWQYRIGTIVED